MVVEETVALVDTDVFSGLYVDPDRAARRGLPVESWRGALAGRQVVLSFQSRAEVLAGARASNWGTARIADVVAQLDRIPTIPADSAVIDAYATLTASCRRTGHALHDKIHTADRWVAACAMAKQVPLLSGDRIYAGAPDLALIAT